MPASIPVITVSLPDYTLATQPDYQAIGTAIDSVLKNHFMGRAIAIRGVFLGDHPGMSADMLVSLILQHGTDRYDPQREGRTFC